MSIGERIAEERKRLGLTQAAFAEKLAISLSSQKRYEKSERVPNIYFIGAMAEIGIDVGYVMTGSRNPFDQVSFYSHLDRSASESLAIAVLNLDTANFAEAISAIPTDDIEEYSRAVLDALIENSPPLLERLKAKKGKALSAKKRRAG